MEFIFIEIVLGATIYFFGIVWKQYQMIKGFEYKNIDFDKNIPLSWLYIFIAIIFFL